MRKWYHNLPALSAARFFASPLLHRGTLSVSLVLHRDRRALGGLPFAGFAKGRSALLFISESNNPGIARAAAKLRR
jgi:hypothetical protein